MTFRRFIGIAMLAAIAAAPIHVVARRRQSKAVPLKASSVMLVPATRRASRPTYPYSVVPGGVYSPSELAKATERDLLTREHYASFDVRSARLTTNPQDQLLYVSYRMNNKIFWTQRRLRIPKGEMLLTDGQNFCRTRCGNRLSIVPQAQINPHEPPPNVINQPDFNPSNLSDKDRAFEQAPPVGELALNAPPLIFEDERLKPIWPKSSTIALPGSSPLEDAELPVPRTVLFPLPLFIPPLAAGSIPPGSPGGPVIVPTTPATPAPVPEPTTLSLLALAVVVLVLVARKQRTETRATSDGI